LYERNKIMRKPFALFAAATLAAGVTFFGYDNSVLAADRGVQDQGIQATAGVRTGAQAGVPQGITVKAEQPEKDKIQSLLADATKSVLSPNFGNLNQYISQADQQRLNLAQAQDQQFNQKIQQFRQLWQAKYNRDFDIDGSVAFGDQFQGFTVVQGEVQNPALLANWPVDPQTEQYRSGTQIQERDRLPQDQQIDTDRPQYDSDRQQTDMDREPQAGTRIDPAAETDATATNPPTVGERSGLQAGVGGPGDPGYRVIPGETDDEWRERDAGQDVALDRDRQLDQDATIQDRTFEQEMDVDQPNDADVEIRIDDDADVTIDRNMQQRDIDAEVDARLNRDRDFDANADLDQDQPADATVGGPGQPPSKEFQQDGTQRDADYPVGADLQKQDRDFEAEVGTDRDRPMAGGREHNLQQGSEVALVNFPEHKGLKPLTVSLVQAEGDQWKIDLPNDLTANDLKSNLDKHLTHLISIQDQWPADRNDASRIVAHHVMMAMYDVDLPGAQGQQQQQPGQMQQQGQQPGQQRDYVQPGQQAQPGQGAGQGGMPQ
jgi:hypothetical protein